MRRFKSRFKSRFGRGKSAKRGFSRKRKGTTRIRRYGVSRGGIRL